MCTPKPKAAAAPPPVAPIEEKEPDLQISAKKAKDKKKVTSGSSSGLNRFLLTPASGGSGANVPE